jgi:hypothetical protein
MEELGLAIVKDLLSDAAKADLSQNLTVFLIAWTMVKRTIKGHFANIESGLKDVAVSVTNLNAAMIKVETNHSSRLKVLEDIVGKLTDKVNRIEQGDVDGKGTDDESV